MALPLFEYKKHAQKQKNHYDRILSKEILRNICRQITGKEKYKVKVSEDGYNKGRLITLEYKGVKNYITLSEKEISGRNSSMQSVPTALNLFYADETKEKRLYYYFLPSLSGNAFTEYHMSYYRLLKTAGVIFLNLPQDIQVDAYEEIDDFIIQRDAQRSSNKANKSSYITQDRKSIQIYAKVYGANKYESTLYGIVASILAKRCNKQVYLYNIVEQDLSELPKSSRDTLLSLGNVHIVDTLVSEEEKKFNTVLSEKSESASEEQASGEGDVRRADSGKQLRSNLYIYNLLQSLGHKKCIMCDCEISEIIQACHIWSISAIKSSNASDDEKFRHATSGSNGLWLCPNHHKLFDTNIIRLDEEGNICFKNNLPESHTNFLSKVTLNSRIDGCILTDEMRFYIRNRNKLIAFD